MTRARDLAKFNLDGQAVTINESSADLDFRVESNGNANMLFVDGGNNHVNIGSSTDANGVLNVSDGTSFSTGITVENTGDTHGSVIDFLNNSESPADNDYIGGLVFKETNSAGGTHQFAKIFGIATDITDGTEDGALTFEVSAGGANTAECMRIKAGGDIQIGEGDIFFSTAGKGIVLGATSNTDANTLDDYEEGTFTPTILGSSSNPSSTYSSQVGIYTKIGNLVRVKIFIETSNYSGGSGDLRIGDLPFTSRNVSNASSVGSVNFYRVNSFDDGNDSAYVGDNKNYVSILGRAGTSASDTWSSLPVSVWTSANPTAINLNVTYFT